MSRLGAVGLGVVLLGCGARTGLEVTTTDAGPDAPVLCRLDADCDDGVACTDERCVAQRCVVTARDERCEDGIFCNGLGRCTASGCTIESLACDDSVACTVDTCDEEARACTHQPDVDLCPISHRCDPILDCVARALVNDDRGLSEVDLPSGVLRQIAPLDVPLTDIALHPDGRLFGVNRTALYEVEEATGRTRLLADIPGRLVALEVGPDGALYGAGGSDVIRIDPSTYALRRIGSLPRGTEVSGDIAFIEGELYVTATRNDAAPDVLMRVPGEDAAAIELGSTGSTCVWALAPFGTTLYGLTCTGQLTRIDTRTGFGTLLQSDLGTGFNGAAAR